MNALIWSGQIVVAAVFLITGFSKMVAFTSLIHAIETRRKTEPITVTPTQARIVGLLEMIGAIGVIFPPDLTPGFLASEYLLTRLAAAGLALLMAVACIYHFRRNESAAPAISAFLLALFVIVGRWPH